MYNVDLPVRPSFSQFILGRKCTLLKCRPLCVVKFTRSSSLLNNNANGMFIKQCFHYIVPDCAFTIFTWAYSVQPAPNVTFLTGKLSLGCLISLKALA